jgi:hypothetical protein
VLRGEPKPEAAQKWAPGFRLPEEEPLLLALWTETGALLGVALLGSALFLGPALLDDLRPALGHHSELWLLWVWLLPAATLSVALAPGAALRVALRGIDNKRITLFLVSFACWLGWIFILGDQALSLRFGRHFEDIVAYLKVPEAHAAAGDASGNVLLSLVLSFWALIGTFSQLALKLAFSRLAVYLSPLLKGTIATVILTLLLGLSSSLWLVPPLLPDGFGPRLVESLALRPARTPTQSKLPHDPSLAALQVALEKEYARFFPYLFRRHPQTEALPTQVDSPPQIALIVAESLRWEALNPEDMPRLHAWSQNGLVATRHYASSNHSESGLFVLLYGESALRFNSTLNQKVAPSLCRLLRPSGYRCSYYTGHPKIWLRREEFLNEQTMDDFVHDNRGTWNDWDQTALSTSAAHLARSERRFSLTFLMSSHYEYRYPEAYRKHLPDDPPSTSWVPGQAKRSEFRSNRNRYLNVSRYLDDLVADHIETLGENTLVIFTGDHGESTGEDGKFGHGYGFSDLLTRVPFVAVGPGVPKMKRTDVTSHRDLLPSILHAVGIPTATTALSPGIPLQKEPPRERSLLSTYTQVGRPRADALLLTGSLRLRLVLDPTRPGVEVRGLVDAFDRPLSRPITPKEAEQLRAAFVEELERAGHSVH